MKIPKRLQPLVEDGLIDDVLYQLMSGKEATVFAVTSQGEVRCAKVYKEAMKRSFKKAAQYQEGRKVKNSRRARAMEKGSSFGRKQQEDAWQNAEVDALFTLSKAGVRVPQPFGCYDGVLLMELVTDDEGNVAPRLNDVSMSAEQALEDHAQVMHYVLLMLCAGIVHGDLSEFNVLVDSYGPVIIDLPQAVNAAANNNAFSMLQRDVRNMTDYYAEFAPELKQTHYAEEMWALFQTGELSPETELTGYFEFDESEADVDTVLEEIKAAFEEEQARVERMNDANSDDE
ncbi:PA4780 family RIO1-like protein kinase [Brumicola pallidula]|jgi:RIO kinase 1|uniref:non-specific serine/threonine protein kinase n=1 Tax=Brumicola pallidula DSM 14239 = ACAM 615 TaxID=1121922 RepID=K6ZPE8_9ALTE|nr:PA4780 family RIO1-like protein kinase [Glaciecola pallidula]GAC30758.1 RIO kinase 1 [Glaciecola pallidula DSM 14239 = ACAM 615]